MTGPVLKTEGTAFAGWKEVTVRRSIETLVGTFDFGATERYPGPLPQRKMLPGQSCTVELEDEVVITGWIDSVAPAYDADNHSVRVRGRDRAADLVDCSALHKPGEWTEIRMERLAGILAKPFGVTVKADVSTGDRFRKFTLQKGETAWEAIERMARQRGVLVVSDGEGGLLITRAGLSLEGATLKTGGVPRILSGSATYSDVDRFSEYHTRAQASGTDDFFGTAVAQVSAIARDPNVSRYRPLIVMAEEQPGPGKVQERATWEASSRAGRSRRATLTVQGWKAQAGVWQPNRRVQVDDELLGIQREMLIVAVEHTLGERGTRTTLELARPEAFELLALPEPSGGTGTELTGAVPDIFS